MIVTESLTLLGAVLALAYYIRITSYAGKATSFGWFFLLMGVSLLIFDIPLFFWKASPYIDLYRKLFVTIELGIVVYFISIGLVIYCFGRRIPKNIKKNSVVIVLGAQIRGQRINKSVRYRLMSAEQFLREHPDTFCVVSGGQGKDEPVSEAEAMRDYLLRAGISEERIWMEPASTNTVENLRFSRELLARKGYLPDAVPVLVISNEFHVFRACAIAKRQGFFDVQGLGARTDRTLRVCYYFREVLAVTKDFLSRSMKF